MNFKKNNLFLLLYFLHIILLTQLMFTVWPEMILYPYLQMNGFLLYQDIINPYFPLLPTILFIYFKMFGLTILNLKIFTWILILITDGVIIYSAKHFYQQKKDLFITFVTFIPFQIYFGGNGLWFELVLTPFILLSLIFVYFYPNNFKKILLSITFFSMAVLIKQNVLLFLIPITLFLFFQKQYQNMIIFLSGTALILGIGTAVLVYFNLWNDFFIWAIKLPLTFSNQHGFVSLPALRQYPLILLPLVTLIPFLIAKKMEVQKKLFWFLNFLIALQFVFPRFENFHLQLIVALSSIFAPMLSKKYLLIFLSIIYILFGTYFLKSFHKQDRFIDQSSLELSNKIQKYSSVYILNGPELSYFFAHKLPPKPWGTNFPWYFEVNNFENRFINALNDQKTDYIIIGDPIGGGPYDLGNYSPPGLLKFIEYNYLKVERFQNYSIWQRKSNFQ